MSALLRRACCLLALLAPTLLPLPASAGPLDVPALLPLQAAELPQECGCSFGTRKGVPLIFWSWENDKQNAVIREASGARKLTLRSEKYLPVQHEPAHPGDRMTLQFSNADWSLQTVSEVTASCSAKAKSCKGTDYRSHLILQWQGRHRLELRGWGHCGC